MLTKARGPPVTESVTLPDNTCWAFAGRPYADNMIINMKKRHFIGQSKQEFVNIVNINVIISEITFTAVFYV